MTNEQLHFIERYITELSIWNSDEAIIWIIHEIKAVKFFIKNQSNVMPV